MPRIQLKQSPNIFERRFTILNMNIKSRQAHQVCRHLRLLFMSLVQVKLGRIKITLNKRTHCEPIMEPMGVLKIFASFNVDRQKPMLFRS